ncbi:UDP-N-acetylmuramoyl-tripeptide--D-alanyl-D-alanine ligase [Clostridium saccharobutylicum]|uniref:UDP-N-acetylmuramoyl-tripeptide--D-alanyl-D-alanine ligase n=1 Tax=Clostridium saccharobutylicum DSM 13864 TaxID=1345695 RepID=U5MW74_CLOSA|nr:UDP-N-acetylmuramoyl-tripeptide--D-alanyl-D-alanine ligase [Clostridium saccharobutylicum]AGX43702.1 UDP-N-acetylmuramoyl-tripeptide--D-alanyl-D-alanine ligase MurF [Clostridium saccharobutylicum DSM 13864]AQR91000.1 UDP-N-acetylmuramoyl-tripeptide--D-alanyl-D-alanine ligase [Clostridium saccharobutylicum]AQS00904.1 UDP-N-acetylmuramoyl-tripeptide--D-alanyl-D-alanine ligase [Clostridium saccharobutylicum]AQS10642.1 UDP-N-acetylmuramoyl-tripeptide--D-alanyl-D-alanine ligase [Clostridium sacch
MDLTLNEIIKAIEGKILIQNNEGKFNKVSTDTRKIEKNDLFIALKGENFNGNNYVVSAIEKGAAIVIIDEIKFKEEELGSKGTIIVVDNTKKALGDLARFYRQKLGIKVVGITGSTGKTSTKDLIAAFLSGKYKVFKTKGNFNNEIGLPLMIFELSKDYDVAVLEMGTSNFGEINRLARIAMPDIGAITNIGVAHIEYLKTRENILKEKMCIADFFENKNSLVINCENDMLKTVNEYNKAKLEKIGYDESYDLYAKNVKLTCENTSFDVITKDNKSHTFTLNMIGEHNVLNALLGIQISIDLGLTFEEMERGLENFQATSMRLEFIKKNDFTIINDSYNANPDSMKAALEVLKNYSGSRKIAVLGTMGELGEHANEAHRSIGEFAKEKADILVTTGEFKDYYKEGFKEGTITFETKEELVENLTNIIKPGDTILVKASRSAKFEEIIKGIEK